MSKKPSKAEKEVKAKASEEVEEEVEETEEEVEEEVAEEEESVDDEVEEKEVKANDSDKYSVDIISRGRTYIRTYSKKVHGKDFMKMAEGLVAHYPRREYTIVPSNTVLALEVRYREKEDAELPLDRQKMDSPMMDKSKMFTDRDEALRFNVLKKGAIIAKAKSIK